MVWWAGVVPPIPGLKTQPVDDHHSAMALFIPGMQLDPRSANAVRRACKCACFACLGYMHAQPALALLVSLI